NIRYQLWDYRTPESENLRAAAAALSEPRDVLFVYTAELDALMHRVGIFHDAVGARLESYAQFLDGVRNGARAHDVELEIVLLSDHGMTDVTDTVDVWQAMEQQGWKVGRNYTAFFDSTMARTWGDEAVAEAVTRVLGEKGRRLDAPQLRAFGCYFPGG